MLGWFKGKPKGPHRFSDFRLKPPRRCRQHGKVWGLLLRVPYRRDNKRGHACLHILSPSTWNVSLVASSFSLRCQGCTKKSSTTISFVKVMSGAQNCVPAHQHQRIVNDCFAFQQNGCIVFVWSRVRTEALLLDCRK